MKCAVNLLGAVTSADWAPHPCCQSTYPTPEPEVAYGPYAILCVVMPPLMRAIKMARAPQLMASLTRIAKHTLVSQNACPPQQRAMALLYAWYCSIAYECMSVHQAAGLFVDRFLETFAKLTFPSCRSIQGRNLTARATPPPPGLVEFAIFTAFSSRTRT